MSEQNIPKASPKVKPPFIPAPAAVSQDLQRQVDFLNAQLRGGRALIKALERQLKEGEAERDKLAGIGIECGCGEADCTADADNLRDALAQIRRLKAEIESLRASSFVTAVPSEHYERLVAAGDALYESQIGYYGEQILEDMKHHPGGLCRNWIAAKGGKQTK